MNRYIKYIIEALVHNEPNKFFTDVLDYGYGDGDEENGVILAALDGVSVMGDNDKHLLKLFKNTLCKSGDYHKVVASTPEVPTVYKVSEVEYYVAPWTNFKFNYVPEDKKTSYPIGRFYRYHIIFEGTKIHLSVTLSKLSDKIVINEYISSFIQKSIEPIEHITFHREDSANTEKDKAIIYKDWSPAMQLMIFAPKDKDGKDIKFSDNYVDNFPVKLDPPANEYAKPARIWKKSCETPEVFYRFVKKLINAGWQVQDEEKNIYKTIEDVDNIEEYVNSGQKAADLQKQEDEHLQFLINQLGEDTVNKLSIAIDAAITADNNKRNAPTTYNSIYLKSINRLRKVKICYELTFIPMALDNNIQLDEKVALSKSIKGAVLYKLMYNAQEFNMQDYRPRGTKSSGGIYSLKSCTEYFIDDDYDEYAEPGYTKKLDINDLPIKIFNVQSLYKLYFLIGVTLKQINGIDRIEVLEQALGRYNRTIDDTKPYLYSNYPEWNSFYNERDVSRYNHDIRDMNGVDFTVLNEQLTHIANYYSKAAKKRK